MSDNKLFKNMFAKKDDTGDDFDNNPLLDDSNSDDNKDDKKDEAFDIKYQIDNDSKDESGETDKPQDFFFEDPNSVRMLNPQTVLFQGPVTERSVNSAIRFIKQAYLNICNINTNYPDLKGKMNIRMVLDTPGGSIIAGFRLVDAMQYYNKNTDVNIETVVEGMCASMGVPLLLSGVKKTSTPNSTIMIHSLSSFMGGNYHQMKDYMKFYTDLQEKLIVYIVKNSKAKEDDIRELFKRESFLTAEEALKYGIIDEIGEIFY